MSESRRLDITPTGTEPPRGMRDVLPLEAEVRDAAARIILDTYRRHGFRRIETPAVESLRLLTRGEGGDNEKLIFKILKRGEKLDLAGVRSEDDLADLGLRFDLTVPLARYYAHNHARLPRPLKAVQIGPVWRAERPQKGRFRQFTQCDIDILGVREPVAEVELILATTEALTALGLEELTVRLNDRRLLTAIAGRCGFAPDRHGSLFVSLDKWDKLGRQGVAAELAAAGHPAAATASLTTLLGDFDPRRGLDSLRPWLGGVDDGGAFEALACILRTAGTAGCSGPRVVFDPTLVRGMGYYTGPIFEIGSAQFPSSIAGGGRYDQLIGKILGRDVPATGFSIGFERVVTLLLERPTGTLPGAERIALLFEAATPDLGPVLAAARRLRAEGFLVSLEPLGRKAGSQRAALAEHGFDGVAVFDGTELPAVRRFRGAAGAEADR
jgi:histidyl-tRNA synthetase